MTERLSKDGNGQRYFRLANVHEQECMGGLPHGESTDKVGHQVTNLDAGALTPLPPVTEARASLIRAMQWPRKNAGQSENNLVNTAKAKVITPPFTTRRDF